MVREIAHALIETTLSGGAVILLMSMVRKPLLTVLGAQTVCTLWLFVPLACLAALIPEFRVPTAVTHLVAEQLSTSSTAITTPRVIAYPGTSMLFWVWLAGALITATALLTQQIRYQRSVQAELRTLPGSDSQSNGLPAVLGLVRPRIVLPADFEVRYNSVERELIMCHERAHLQRCDIQFRAIAALLQCIYWFNPLFHYAARRFRRDQELACDACVIAVHPHRRRTYADAMIKTHSSTLSSTLSCQWLFSKHQLTERVAMLKFHARTPVRPAFRIGLIALLSLVTALTALASQQVAKPNTDILYTINMHLVVDGESHDLKMITRPGKPFSFTTTGKREWSGKFTVQPWTHQGKPAALVAGSISVDGAEPVTPKIGISMGKKGSIIIADDKHSANADLKLDVVVTEPTPEELALVAKE